MRSPVITGASIRGHDVVIDFSNFRLELSPHIIEEKARRRWFKPWPHSTARLAGLRYAKLLKDGLLVMEYDFQNNRVEFLAASYRQRHLAMYWQTAKDRAAELKLSNPERQFAIQVLEEAPEVLQKLQRNHAPVSSRARTAITPRTIQRMFPPGLGGF